MRTAPILFKAIRRMTGVAAKRRSKKGRQQGADTRKPRKLH